MKKLGLFCSIFFLASVSSVFAAPKAQAKRNVQSVRDVRPAIDWKHLNPVMASLLELVIQGDELIDFAYPRFDENFSSLAKERLKYDLEGALKNTPWLEGGIATAKGSATFATDRSPKNPGVFVQATAEIKSDIFAMIRYTGYLALKKADVKDLTYGERFLAHFRRLSVSRTFEDLYEIVLSAHQLGKDELAFNYKRDEEFLKKLEAGLISGYDPDAPKWYRKKLQFHAQAKEALDKLKFRLLTQNGKAVGMEISGYNIDQIFYEVIDREGALPREGTLRFEYQSIKATASVFSRTKMSDLDNLKSNLNTHLKGAENGNEFDKEVVQSAYRLALIEFKRFVRGDVH